MADPARLSQSLTRLDRGAAEAQSWVEDLSPAAASVARQADSLIDAARHARLLSRRLGLAADRNNCVGVFGPSQAGKSYLVSALARPRDGRLAIRLGGESRDFLREINPPGDRESTGLVTRFSAQAGAGAGDPDYPVEVRLLTETDLVKILANSFFLDFDPNSMTIEPVEEEDVRAALREAEAAAHGASAAHLDEIALFDLSVYFRRGFRSRIGAFDRADYWRGLIRVAGRLPLGERAKLFSLLWGRAPEFTELFIHLAEALASIGHPAEARVVAAGLVPREAGTPPEPSSIIDVAVLSRLRTERDRQDEIALRPVVDGVAGPAAILPRATLTALIAEVRLTMETRPWPFFETTDLLDFPGARSRLKLQRMPEGEEERNSQLRELYLRGKIAYLFQRYTDELELTSMLLCMPDSVAEVKDLAGMVKSWIDATHGATAERRRAVKNALFLVLTKHDRMFEEKGGEDDESRRGKWDRRLHASLLELYGKDGWTEDWDGAPFSNSVFLRNPGVKQMHLMRYLDEDALLEDRPVESGAYATYREGFLGSALTARYFVDREAVWNAAMVPNDGGVRYLVEARLSPILDPELRRNQATERLQEAADALSAPLRAFHSADGANARREKDEKLIKLRRDLNAGFKAADYRSFAHFRRGAMLDPADVRGVFLNVAALKEEDEAAPTAAAEDDDPWASPASEAAAPPRRERPELFADRLMNLWAARLRDLQRDGRAMAELGANEDAIGEVIEELLVGAGRSGLSAIIAEEVREATKSAALRWADVADRVSQRVAMRFNDYVAYLGFAETPTDRRPGFPEPPQAETRKIFSHGGLKHEGDEIGDERERLDLAAFMDWGVALRAFGLSNVGHSAGREISDEANRRLGEILDLVEIDRAAG